MLTNSQTNNSNTENMISLEEHQQLMSQYSQLETKLDCEIQQNVTLIQKLQSLIALIQYHQRTTTVMKSMNSPQRTTPTSSNKPPALHLHVSGHQVILLSSCLVHVHLLMCSI